jgi:hypothetical protein
MGAIHYNGANVWLDGENEKLNPWMLTDPEQYKRSKETCYDVYLNQVAIREQNAISKAKAQAEQDEQSRLDAICIKNDNEADALWKSLRSELCTAQLQATSFKAFLKDNKSVIEQLTALNTLRTVNIFAKY